MSLEANLSFCTFFVSERHDLVPNRWWQACVLESSVVWWTSPCIAWVTDDLPPVGDASRSPILEPMLSPPVGHIKEEVIPSVTPRALDERRVYSVCERCRRIERHCCTTSYRILIMCKRTRSLTFMVLSRLQSCLSRRGEGSVDELTKGNASQ